MKRGIYRVITFGLTVLLLVGCTELVDDQSDEIQDGDERFADEVSDLRQQINILENQIIEYEDLILNYQEEAAEDLDAIRTLMDRVSELNLELIDISDDYDRLLADYERLGDNSQITIDNELDFPGMIGNLNSGVVSINQYNLDVVVESDSSVDELTEVTVFNIDELLEAIRPNTKILLAGGSYNIDETNYDIEDNPYLSYFDEYDGLELIISDVANLILVGQAESAVQILTKPSYADVLTFENCENIQLENLIIGHSNGIAMCSGGVVQFNQCCNIMLDSCLLFGCGIYGITGNSSCDVTVQDSIIEKCSTGFIDINGFQRVEFNNCIFRDTEGFELFCIQNGESIVFNTCEVFNSSVYTEYGSVIVMDRNSDVCFYSCKFNYIISGRFWNNLGELSFPGCTFENNSLE